MQKSNQPLRNRIRAGIEILGIKLDRFLSGNQSTVQQIGISGDQAALVTVPTVPVIMRRGQRDGFTETLNFRSAEGENRTVTIRREHRSPDVALHGRRLPDTSLVRKPSKPASDVAAMRPYAGRRVSMENPSIIGSGLETFIQFNRGQYWHQQTISSRFNTDNFSRIEISELTDLLTELSPEVSSALWYYLLCCNSGYEIEVFRPDTETIYEDAQKYLNACLKTLGGYHGTLNTFFDKTFMAIFMRGAFLYEAIFAENGRDFVDMAAPDPKSLHFKRIIDPIRGQVWDFGQYQNGTWVSLNIPTVRYIPLHPLPGRIEGRPMISPVFFTAIFLMSVLRDLKRVIQQQGYMRLDLEVMFEKLKDQMPEDADTNPEAVKAWADGVINEVMAFYGQLEPDDAFVHSDAVKVNNPVGTANTNSLTAMDSLFRVLERMAVRALKTLPALLGLEGSSDQGTQNRLFEFYQKGNETIQRMVETAFGEECGLILQAGGYQADVRVKFAQMRASEEMRDTQVLNLKAQVGAFWYDRGWYSQDEAAKFATGKDAADTPEPRSAGATLDIGNIQTLQPDPGINRFFAGLNMARTPSLAELNHARELWRQNAPDEAADLIDALPMPADV